MARDLDAKCRQCRREGEKLFLKGEKCFTDKCAIERRSYAPGQHGQKSGGRMSDFGKQLREKQKLRRDRKSTRLNSSHLVISYAVFCLKKKQDTPRSAAL